MEILNFIIENKEFAKIIYGILIVLICAVIVLKTDKLYKLSSHKGIRYFRNAFFFFGIAFFIRYILNSEIHSYGIALFKEFFEFFMIMGGFFLLYSLIWKKVESPSEKYTSSLFNGYILIFYLMTLTIVIADYNFGVYYFMFLSQIIVFTIATMISFVNFYTDNGKGKFLKFYFLAMILSLTAWVLNGLVALYLEWDQIVLVSIYLIDSLIFLMFLFGVLKITKK